MLALFTNNLTELALATFTNSNRYHVLVWLQVALTKLKSLTIPAYLNWSLANFLCSLSIDHEAPSKYIIELLDDKTRLKMLFSAWLRDCATLILELEFAKISKNHKNYVNSHNPLWNKWIHIIQFEICKLTSFNTK